MPGSRRCCRQRFPRLRQMFQDLKQAHDIEPRPVGGPIWCNLQPEPRGRFPRPRGTVDTADFPARLSRFIEKEARRATKIEQRSGCGSPETNTAEAIAGVETMQSFIRQVVHITGVGAGVEILGAVQPFRLRPLRQRIETRMPTHRASQIPPRINLPERAQLAPRAEFANHIHSLRGARDSRPGMSSRDASAVTGSPSHWAVARSTMGARNGPAESLARRRISPLSPRI